MTRTSLAPATTPTEPGIDTTLIDCLTSAVEQILTARVSDLELRCFTPKEAGQILGKSENWVVENIQARRIPFTYVGRSPRLTAEHIRWIQAQGEVRPSRYAARAA
ncbi:hypothetical protein [Streptomyces sp. UH6]|uniref:hypothetical protein n=1 Tax=Streptomyces sp. UH6 TaxID=2748379 RepID=UPI0015D47165|nr:hypothetical protein [Streptomyces sp. UH6]NYV73103.1 hypothetical protein [Streptomyces sp. UH6]